ncbi:MAG TPA: o-succinylbenzoate synthase, partial [Opitutaceae bacterium]|nr:o-succinylbenzoate synthase [Opitutaceae bacterium]
MTYELDHRRYALPFRTPLRTAHGRWSVREGLLLRLRTEEGATGYGEVAPIPGFGRETLELDEAALIR